MTTTLDVPKILREARGDMTFEEFQEKTGIYHPTQRAWERGERRPMENTVNKLAEALGWDDEKRMAMMPEPKVKGLPARLTKHMQYIKINVTELALMMNVSPTTVSHWRSGNIPKRSRTIILDFLKMDEETAQSILEYNAQPVDKKPKTENRKRIKINYEYIYYLEGKYGSLAKADDNDPVLELLRREMNGVKL